MANCCASWLQIFDMAQPQIFSVRRKKRVMRVCLFKFKSDATALSARGGTANSFFRFINGET